MRRATAWVVVVGVAVLGTAGPVSAADGFWVSITSGGAGSSSPSGYQDWWFETPHGPPPVAVTRLSSDGTVEVSSGGASSFLSGAAVPVVVHTTDGYAYLAGGPKPGDLSSALRRQTAGGQGLATAAPEVAAATLPDNAVQLTADLSEPGADGARALKVAVTDPLLKPLGDATVTVPDGGWWVIGLGAGLNDVASPPDPTPVPVPTPTPVLTPTPGPVATPEPATGLLLGFGGLAAAGWRLVKRRRLK